AVASLTMDQTVEALEELLREGGRGDNPLAMNAAKLVSVSNDPELVEKFSTATLVTADGQALVWASRLLGDPLPERVAGIDLMDRLVELSAHNGRRIYLLGATEEVVRRVRWRFLARGANVVGFHNGYWRRDGMSDEQMAELVSRSTPDIVLVGVPSPLKEDFVFGQKELTGAGICVGVGGSFDVVAGRTSRAPRWMQRSGMEWFWRLVQEPRRMFKRYLVGNTKFIWLVMRARWHRG
ncbi:WecB/TagA/CpsF family glycosyltransferase, partial [Kocuria sp.]|uniref:WecB/TagA/CpsF family glycosyltransferase n=1 Tax=Kocuria sp. TaxID=1871328 RepID=UPI00264A3FF8